MEKVHTVLTFSRFIQNVGGLGKTRFNRPVVCHCYFARYKSTPATTVTTDSTSSRSSASQATENETVQRDPLDLTFTNTKNAYKSKTTWELIRAVFVLKLCSFPYIVENQDKLMKLGKKVLGKRLFRSLVRNTFYKQFVAGENEGTIKPLIERLRSFGVKSILDYSAEEDLSEEEAKTTEMQACEPNESSQPTDMKQYQPHLAFADRRKFHVTARTYFYLNEATCERNTETFFKCIDAVAGTTKHTGFAAIKLTALGRPQLLLQLSEVIARTRMFFKQVTGEENMALQNVTPTILESKLDRYKINTHNEEVKRWFERMDYDKKGLINLFSWSGLVDTHYMISDLFKVPNIQTGKMERIIKALTEEEEEMFRNMMRRVHLIARFARDRDVRVMIDAEQSYFQPAISRITMELMRKYNKEKAIIFNTYQCYLKDAYKSIVMDLEISKRQNTYFGAKLVRGAYIEQERMRAAQIGYEDPTNPTFEATTEMYHKTLTEVLKQILERGDQKIAAMVASHNEDTVRFAIRKMDELGLKPEHKVLCFGQLLGMCDQISFTLGQAGYSVYKYVPYGPVDDVIPYLSRRAQENVGMLTKLDKEIKMLLSEIFRRTKSGELGHKPVGNYNPI